MNGVSAVRLEDPREQTESMHRGSRRVRANLRPEHLQQSQKLDLLDHHVDSR